MTWVSGPVLLFVPRRCTRSTVTPASVNSPNPEMARWFSTEVQPHEPRLRAYLRGRFPDLQSDVDDLVQETYLRAYRAKQTGKQEVGPAYLYVVARNAALDLFRRRKVVAIDRVADLEQLDVVEEKRDAAQTAIHEQELEILAQAIDALPDRCREVFLLRRFENASHKEISAQLGMAENTVNAHLVSAMVKVRAYLLAHGVTRMTAQP